MSKTIVKRKVDSLGRVHIPTKVRHELGIEPGDIMTIESFDKEIVIYKSGDYCKICGHEATEKIKNNFICDNCILDIKNNIDL